MSLEEAFSDAIRQSMDKAWSEHRLRFPRFEQMRSQYGDLIAAKKLLESDQISDGLTKLFMVGAQNLSVEGIVVDERFRDLFSDEEIAQARKKLEG